MSRLPRMALRDAVSAPPDGVSSGEAASRYAARVAADVAEACARGWVLITAHYPAPGLPSVPMGQPATIRGRRQKLPDYGAGVDGGYRRTAVSEATP